MVMIIYSEGGTIIKFTGRSVGEVELFFNLKVVLGRKHTHRYCISSKNLWVEVNEFQTITDNLTRWTLDAISQQKVILRLNDFGIKPSTPVQCAVGLLTTVVTS
ncbi:hypothetical protein EVAR_46240_1 [Eumeta japonica]|uniref:Uncharacterized protein n=1 Tax=Eumeta variegata TaxID=151549 RepID=A0A4C1XKP6_EUMVA|nr:hypothetical protein EVAR_46240_1 [Eumeta japonica]